MEQQLQEALQELQKDKDELLNLNFTLGKSVKQAQSILTNVFQALGLEADENGVVTLDAVKERIEELKNSGTE